MTGWAWQDDACFSSCSRAVETRAAGLLKRTAEFHETLRALVALQPLVSLDADTRQTIAAQAAALARQSQRLVVVGTGGASLGAQALCALAEHWHRVGFLENCDPLTLQKFLQLPPENTAWLVVSKSGETVETLAAALSLIGRALPASVRVVTANPGSTLGKLAVAQGWEIIDHPSQLGGRFSAFSVVGLLPAAYAGLDIDAIAAAAEARLSHGLAAPEATLNRHAAWIAASMAEKPMQLLMAYADCLRPATQWWKQLWAESLGKDGRGQTPLTAIGAIDQHSQLQLYLDGPRDKLLTLWLPAMGGIGAALPVVDQPGLAYLGGHAMGDVMQATAEATVKTLGQAGVALRVVRGALGPESLAEWMVERMLETLLVAAMIGVDPYSQPAVEEGKKLARAALGA